MGGRVSKGEGGFSHEVGSWYVGGIPSH